MTTGTTWTVERVLALGLTTDIVTVGSILGLGRNTMYELAREGELPFVHRLGSKYVVSVPRLMAYLNEDATSLKVTAR